jgi:dTDP-4-dehydrorhamnose 3,5-epimerase
MIFQELKLKGAFLIKFEKIEDERGFFARSWCVREAEKHGLKRYMVQANVSFNKKKGTLRGMHYQKEPFQEVKLVRCVRGRIYDVIIDLRPKSPTFCHWIGLELSQDNDSMLYVPENFAHGFQTLTDNSEVNYLVSEFYTPEAEKGIRFNDPFFDIQWPEVQTITISRKDNTWPDFN